MKLLALFILYKEGDTQVKILQNEVNLGSFGYFEGHSVKELLVFAARTVTERTSLNTKQSVKLDENVNALVHIYVRCDGLASAAFSDSEYPQRVAYSLLSKIMDDFTQTNPADTWVNMAENAGKMETMSETLKKYQNPQEADPLMGLQKDLVDIKVIMVNTLIDTLKRGEKLDDLFARSNDLSLATKSFYKQVKKSDQCCTLF